MSDLRVETISDAAGTGPATLTKQAAAKAWANINGAGTTVNNSLNVTSVTDEGTGDVSANFTNVFVDADFAAGISHYPDIISLSARLRETWRANLSANNLRFRHAFNTTSNVRSGGTDPTRYEFAATGELA